MGSQKYFPAIRTIYVTYKAMMYRCYNPKDPSYFRYGGNGVTVCDEWKNDYQKFLDWSLANGWKEDLELDKDIDSDGKLYSPETCKWVTHKENMLNLSRFKNIEYNGKMYTISGLSSVTGIPKSAIRERMKVGKTIYEAIEIGAPKAKSGKTKYHTHGGVTLSLKSMCKRLGLKYHIVRRRVNDDGLTFQQAITS